MGFLSGFAQKVSATAKPGGELSSGQAPWFMGGNKLVDLLRKARELETAQLAQTAAPAAPASDIQGSIRRNLALTNLNPFQYATGGGYGAGGGGITGLPQYAAATAQQQNLAQQQALQIAAQNQAPAVPLGPIQLPGQQPVNVGAIGSPAMNQYLAQYGIGPVAAHAGGFVHQHPLPGERILR